MTNPDNDANSDADTADGHYAPQQSRQPQQSGIELPIDEVEVAKLTQVTVRTLRYYDDEGLVPASRREFNGRCWYSYPALIRLAQVLLLRHLDVPIEHVRQVISHPDAIKGELRSQERELVARCTAIEQQLEALHSLLAPGKIGVGDLFKTLQSDEIAEGMAEVNTAFANMNEHDQEEWSKRVEQSAQEVTQLLRCNETQWDALLAADPHLDGDEPQNWQDSRFSDGEP